jgi:hypothetical protein
MLIGMTTLTTIKVPGTTRDLVRDQAASHGMTQAELIEHAIHEMNYREWLAKVESEEPSEEYLAEMREWDRADLGGVL